MPVGLIPDAQADAQTVQTRVRRLLLECLLYFDDDDDDDGNYGDGDDGALIPDQDLILLCTNNYCNLPSEGRTINSSPCW